MDPQVTSYPTMFNTFAIELQVAMSRLLWFMIQDKLTQNRLYQDFLIQDSILNIQHTLLCRNKFQAESAELQGTVSLPLLWQRGPTCHGPCHAPCLWHLWACRFSFGPPGLNQTCAVHSCNICTAHAPNIPHTHEVHECKSKAGCVSTCGMIWHSWFLNS